MSGFDFVEGMLYQILRVVPYCAEHEAVWSPQLATILLETCSQLDSLWKSQNPAIAKPGIKDHFESFGKNVGPHWLIFWGEKAEVIKPFDLWGRLPSYTQTDYVPLSWWQAYNDVKHDCLANTTKATLKVAVCAVAALVVAIVRCPDCAEGIAQAGWVPGMAHSGLDPRDYLIRPPSPNEVVETKMFSFPLHSGTGYSWSVTRPHASCRFLRWMEESNRREW
jgi:hypothetical protein